MKPERQAEGMMDCTICGITLNSATTYRAHIEGMKHLKRVQQEKRKKEELLHRQKNEASLAKVLVFPIATMRCVIGNAIHIHIHILDNFYELFLPSHPKNQMTNFTILGKKRIILTSGCRSYILFNVLYARASRNLSLRFLRELGSSVKWRTLSVLKNVKSLVLTHSLLYTLKTESVIYHYDTTLC